MRLLHLLIAVVFISTCAWADDYAKYKNGAETAFAQGDYEKALRNAETYELLTQGDLNILKEKINHCLKLIKVAETDVENFDWESAVENYRKVLEINPADKNVESLIEKYYNKMIGYSGQSSYELTEAGIDAYNAGDYTTAFNSFFQAAELGDDTAQCNLAVCYFNGNGVQRNYTEAFKWYSKAAEQGNYQAKFSLGNCFYYGLGCQKNYQRAFEIFKEYAEDGQDSAKFNLAICYQYGHGTTKDISKAKALLQELADKGDSKAQQQLKKF